MAAGNRKSIRKIVAALVTGTAACAYIMSPAVAYAQASNSNGGAGAVASPVKVKVPDEHGGHSIETLRVIDWVTPANNEFFLASQMWVAGDMYRRRCDLLGFVNGLPLVFIELKKPAVPSGTYS